MTRKQFKKEYLTNAFFWINEDNYFKIQEILNEFEIKCHTGNGIIKWHDEFTNLCTFEKDKFHNFEYYQKIDVWLPNSRYGEPKNIERLLNYYKELE